MAIREEQNALAGLVTKRPLVETPSPSLSFLQAYEIQSNESHSACGSIDAHHDDWGGLKDAKERRRIQNRLHQRAYRQRKAKAAAEKYMGTSSNSEKARAAPHTSRTNRQRKTGNSDSNESSPGFDSSVPTSDALFSTNLDTSPELLMRGLDLRAMSAQYEFVLPEDDETWFPLSPDNKLLFVVAHNLIRGCMANSHILRSLPREMVYDPPYCGQRGVIYRTFRIPPPHDECAKPMPLPAALVPTEVQSRVPHVPLVDIFPCRQFRDNLIWAEARNMIDLVEFVSDMVGNSIGDKLSWMRHAGKEGTASVDRLAGHVDKRMAGMISWSDPWEVGGWELTEEFAKKWSFLLMGCNEAIAATNKWRAMRGERALRL